MKWTVPASLGITYNDKGRGLGLVWQALKYVTTNKGLLGLPASISSTSFKGSASSWMLKSVLRSPTV